MDNQEKSEANDADQRYLPRWDVKNLVFYSLDGESNPKEAKTKDISASGVCIITYETITPPQNINLTIYLSERASFKVKGRVVWIKPSAEENQVGISFNDLTDKTQGLILQHAFEFNKSQVLKHWYEGWHGKK